MSEVVILMCSAFERDRGFCLGRLNHRGKHKFGRTKSPHPLFSRLTDPAEEGNLIVLDGFEWLRLLPPFQKGSR